MSTYRRPSWLVTHALNPMISIPARLGISLRGAQVLTVRGRTSGKPRSTPVNVLEYEGASYLVAPRGDTQWARNLRASGDGELRLGRRRERIHVTEVSDAEKPPLLHAYLQRWARETASHFGADASTSEEELASIAANHPVFRIEAS